MTFSFYTTPLTINWALFDLSEVFILSGGLNGELKHSLSKSLTQAKKTAKSYIDLCGENNFVIELQRIQKKEEEIKRAKAGKCEV